MEKKKFWLLRPVAWISTILLMLLMQFIAEKICILSEDIIYWLNTLSIAVIVILVVSFGSICFGLLIYSITVLPSFIVKISDSIYPSNHAFRYFFIGFWEIIGCAFLIILAITGYVKGGNLFWFYARFVWLILASISMMVYGNEAAKDRNESAA